MSKRTNEFITDIEQQNLSYKVIGLRSTQKNDLILISEVYNLWKEVWHDVFSASDSLESLNPENLLRQNYAGIILKNDELVSNQLVAFNFISSFNLNNPIHQDSEYIQMFQSEFQKLPNINDISDVFTIEYLTANPKWQNRYKLVSMGEMLMRLSILFAHEAGSKMIVGSSRSDINVSKRSTKVGFNYFGKSVKKANYECDLMYLLIDQEQTYKQFNNPEYMETMYKRSEVPLRTPLAA